MLHTWNGLSLVYRVRQCSVNVLLILLGKNKRNAEAAGSTVSEARNLKYVNTYACIQVSNTIIHFTPLIPLLFASLFTLWSNLYILACIPMYWGYW